jgi:hypothetical protein
MNSDFEILISSNPNYEKLVAEIYLQGKFIALLNQDEGPEKIKIEFPSNDVDESLVLRHCYLKDLLEVLQEAECQLLI